tara:strand:- start:1631 stop:3745 length:2115 start_codon:yes stop_codon:yes gene_type:complete
MSALPKIYYNGIDLENNSAHAAFGHTNPTPMVGVTAEMINLGSRWGQTNKITLEGQLTGVTHSPGGYAPFAYKCGADIWEERAQLVSAFRENFRDLAIYENGQEVLKYENCKVESINFEESTLGQNILGYTIELRSYDNFSGTYGVLNPVDTLSFSEGEDGVVNLTHEISAEGFAGTAAGNVSKTAFENAQNWVIGQTGWSNVLGADFTPNFIPNGGTIYPLLISQTETIDRFNSQYGITEQWQFQTKDISGNFITQLSPIDTYSIQFNMADYDGDENTVDIELTRRGDYDKNLDIATLAQTPSPDYLFNIIQNHKESFTDDMSVKPSPPLATPAPIRTHREIIENLFDQPKGFDVNIDTFTNTSVYSATFSDVDLFNGENVYWDVRYNIEADSIAEVDTVTVSGPLVARSKGRLQRDIDIKEFIDAIEALDGGLIGYCYNEAVAAYNSSKRTIHGQHKYFATNHAQGEVVQQGLATVVDYVAREDVLCPQPNNFSLSIPWFSGDSASRPTKTEHGYYLLEEGAAPMALRSVTGLPWTTDLKQHFGGNGEWSLTATFDTSPHLAGKNVKFNYDFTVEHGIHIYTPSPDLKTNGYYLVYDIGGHRKEKVTINTNLSFNSNDNTPGNHPVSRNLVDGNSHEYNDSIINTVTESLNLAGYYIDSENSSGGTQNRNQIHSRTVVAPNNGPQGGHHLPYTDAESYIPPA